jgi:hypothetical protein
MSDSTSSNLSLLSSSQTSSTTAVSGTACNIVSVERASTAVEGGGFIVRRPVGEHTIRKCDPILMLDHFGPTKYAPGEAIGGK